MLVRAEKMFLSGLVFARKITRMILIQNIWGLMGPLMIYMAFMPLFMWEMWDVTPVTHGRTVESSAVFCLSRIRNCFLIKMVVLYWSLCGEPWSVWMEVEMWSRGKVLYLTGLRHSWADLPVIPSHICQRLLDFNISFAASSAYIWSPLTATILQLFTSPGNNHSYLFMLQFSFIPREKIYARDMPKICLRYAQGMSMICPRYAIDMP